MEDDHHEEGLVEGVTGHDERDADEDGVEEHADFHDEDGEFAVGGGGGEGVAVVVAEGGEMGLLWRRWWCRIGMFGFGGGACVGVGAGVVAGVRGRQWELGVVVVGLGFGGPGDDDAVADEFDEEGEEDAGHDEGGCGGFVLDGADAGVGEHEVGVGVELGGD